MKPLIGLSPQYRDYKEMDRSILGKSYTDIVQLAGGLPVVIPPVIEENDLIQLLQRLDGMVLTGGDDLHPSLYEEAAEPLTPKPGHPRRTEHDRRIFKYIWDQKLPTLAICLGLQEVNVFLGGSLYQDIPEQVDSPVVHKIGDWFEARHEVKVETDSRLRVIIGDDRTETNSAHHQAVKDLAEGLKVTALSKDGIIEGLEPVDESIPLIAVQWHPESETNDSCGISLFKWLITESRSRMG